MWVVWINKCQFSGFESLPTTLEVSYNTTLLTIVLISVPTDSELGRLLYESHITSYFYKKVIYVLQLHIAQSKK